MNEGTSLDFGDGTFDITGPLTNGPLLTPLSPGPIYFSGAIVNFYQGTNAVYSQFGDTLISGGTFNYAAPTTAHGESHRQRVRHAGRDRRCKHAEPRPVHGRNPDPKPVASSTSSGGTLIAPSGYFVQAGTFSGSGTIEGAVTNSGAFFPGGQGTAGLLYAPLDGPFGPSTYTQTATGSITFDVGGTAAGTQYDQMLR